MTRFTKTDSEPTTDGLRETFVLEVRPGHVVTRVDLTSRLGAGRKGRAAEVTLYREMTCTCGSERRHAPDSVSEGLAQLHHFDSVEERETYEADQVAFRERILQSLGLEK